MEGGGKKPEKIHVNVTILKGTGLAAKDRNLFGRKTTSDPYVEVWVDEGAAIHKTIGKTKTIPKTLSPEWDNEEFQFTCYPKNQGSSHATAIVLKIWDQDLLSAPDAMGTIRIPVDTSSCEGHSRDRTTTAWYEVPPDSAKNASGRLQVRIQEKVYYSRALIRGNTFPLFRAPIQVGLAWDMINGNMEVDLDVSCVSLSTTGQILLQDTVYYGNTCNTNESVIHSGDQRKGDEEGDDERIMILLNQVPSYILAMYIIVTVVTPDLRLCDVKSTTLRVYNVAQDNFTLCSFTPATYGQDATAMFMVRIARTKLSNNWVLSTIEDTHPTARDFGSLVPYLKSYTCDLLPELQVDPAERVAILRKGGTIRLTDYSPGRTLPQKITFGLAWDVTNGVNIDLDASALLLDSDYDLVDQVWWQDLVSKDKSIHHHGDEQEGDAIGDDEKIDLQLSGVNPRVRYIVFMINSYSGQELDDVARAACRIFDPVTNIEMASYAMTNSRAVDGYTALIVACLFRDQVGNWNLNIISKPTQGKLARDALGTVKDYLRNNPPSLPTCQEEEFEIVVESEMPTHVPSMDEEIVL
jgi:tellurium resistance protein TerZ